MSTPHRYTSVRSGGRALARLAPVVQLGIASLGLAYFLSQAGDLMSDAQFTWAERRITALIAVSTVVGFGLAGWVLGTTLKVLAGLLDVLADGAEASWRTVDLLEQHVIPALAKVASQSGEKPPVAQAGQPPRPAVPGRADALRSELEAARIEEDVDRALDLRDELTRHLRGDALRALDRELASWIKGVVDERARAKDIDWEVARWAARAVDSLGDEPGAESLRAILPEIRRRAGLCRGCGRAVAGGREYCGRCEPTSGEAETPRRNPSREKDRR